MMRIDYFPVLRELEKHHALFSEFWAVGSLVESQQIPTAAIAFDKETGAGLNFLINPDYWAKLSEVDKAFILCHECLHVYFGHGERFKNLQPQRANIAGDIVINHYLTEVFGFNRKDLTFGETYCWIDTVFPGRNDVEKNRSMEYYYALLESMPQQQGNGKGDGSGNGPQTVDDHSGFGDISSDVMEQIKETLEKATSRISNDEMSDFEKKIDSNQDESQTAKKAGTAAGELTKIIKLGKIIKKRKWETVVADVLGRFSGYTIEKDIEQWARENRRLALFEGELMLPADMTEDVLHRNRIDVWFFQDTSGSCVDYAERFFKAAASIPEDRFKIRGFCFDTRVYEVDFKKGELKGFGGTDFAPIEAEIQAIIKRDGCAYPQAVFVITDAEGNPVHPQYPERWHWFLTKPGWGGRAHQEKMLPPKSKKYSLEDYE